MKIVKINSKNFDKIVKIAAETIKNGEIIICPTDTVYGLLADASNEKAVKKVFKIKKRSFDKPSPVFIKDLKMARKLAEISKEQEKILNKFWPGQMTAILFAKSDIYCRVGLVLSKKIGLRIPDYELIKYLLEKINKPLTGTSANISGEPIPTEIKEIINQFKNQKNKPDLIIDAGSLAETQPSTVVDLTEKKPKILRKGSSLIKF